MHVSDNLPVCTTPGMLRKVVLSGRGQEVPSLKDSREHGMRRVLSPESSQNRAKKY